MKVREILAGNRFCAKVGLEAQFNKVSNLGVPANNGVVPTPTARFYVDRLRAWVCWKSVGVHRRAAHAEALGGEKLSQWIREMKRNDEGEVKNIVRRLLPQAKKRHLCLKMFNEAINHANSYGNDKWGTYYLPNKVRLLVGNLIVLSIHRNCIWLALDQQLLESSRKDQRLLKESNDWQWDKEVYPAYSQVPSRNGYYTPSETHSEIWPLIRSLHFEFISKVATKYEKLKKTSQAKHSFAVVSYLRNELEQPVPAPIYEKFEERDAFVLPEEISDDVTFYEGSKQRITVNAYERNSKAREAAIAHYGTRCQACKLDLGEKYGEVGQGLIHVHHLKPLADVTEEYEIDPTRDLVPVCPNCHAIIHKRKPPYTIEELKEFFLRASNSKQHRASEGRKEQKVVEFTEKQGQCLSFIYNYTKINDKPPAEADIQRYFEVTPPTVHQMILKLEQKGLIERVPGQARSVRVLLSPEQLPYLK